MTALADFPELDRAFRDHDDKERAFRRRALIDRVVGHDATPDENDRDRHHAAVQAIKGEVFVGVPDDRTARDGMWR